MHGLIAKPYKKRAAFALLLILVLAALFWTQSRYPALDDKMLMSGAIQLEDPISFEAVLPVSPDMPLVQRIAYSTINWIDTNKKGMSFGLALGAAFLTFFGYLQQRSFRGGFVNSVLGMFIGAPLGVCVNCAAPIAKGLYSAGMRAETTLSAMIASPTLNIVVLTMLFSLLPFYMVLAKLVLSLAVILIAVPVICRFLPREQLQITPVIESEGWDLAGSEPPAEPVLAALVGVLVAYAKNLWFIVKTTVPLMLLAGFLGATVATLIPPEVLQDVGFSLFTVLLVALVGTFLPVPIAFDVVMAGALLSSGLAPGFVMALVFTLGIFSVYSFFIVARAISLRAAVLISLVVVILGVVAGGGAQSYHQWQSDRALKLLLGQAQPFNLIAMAHAADAPAIEITARPFQPRSPAADTPFTRLEGWEIGIDKPIEFSFQDMWPPFWEGRGLSSGDFDRDGDIDLVIASTRVGMYIYENTGAGQFSRIPLALGPLADMPVFNAVLVDMDNDGWLDLFITTYRAGNFLLHNDQGRFDIARLTPVANRKNAVLSIALSFGDPDQDGDLDVALGNWAAGWYRRIPGEESRNRILFNQNGVMDGRKFADLPAQPGETLSILFSDINRDGHSDLLVGNDFEVPDAYYFGDGTGEFSQITYQDRIIPQTTTTTMAIKTADLHNDGMPEIYLAQIAGRSSGVSKTLKMQPLARYCDSIKRDTDRATCLRNMAVKRWYKSGNNFDPSYAGKCQSLRGRDKGECKAMLVKDLAIQQKDPTICQLIPKGQPLAKAYCTIHFWPVHRASATERAIALPQILRSNVLLERGNGPAYADVAEAQGLEVGGWSWDTKIADFDNDGYLDVYIVNGTWVPNEVSPSNLFFHNQGDGRFTEASGPFGLEDYLMTAAATAFDMDGDGDIDLVTHPVNGPITVFRNNTQKDNAIGFEFADQHGNFHSIGTTVEITYGNGKTASRELQLGGGFMSFDAPTLHFGLGAHKAIDGGVIHWADGGTSPLGPMDAGAVYTIKRH